MGSLFFRFKQFTVWHDRCAMKVGTDGVLLGTWCPLPPLKDRSLRALDIGTGSGLIALMIAQRLYERKDIFSIYGIDIDSHAVEQSHINFQQSPWAKQLNSIACTLQDYKAEELFDLIVSNPPYFQNSLRNPDNARATARHTDTLSYQELIRHSAALLSQEGILSLVLPIEAEEEIMALADENQLQATQITYVHSKPGKEAKRILIALIKQPKEATHVIKEHFYIESEDSSRSNEYQELTKDFYL